MSALGIVPEKAERSELGVLPQHFADRFGWEELTAITAKAWHALTPDEQSRAIIVTKQLRRGSGVQPRAARNGRFALSDCPARLAGCNASLAGRCLDACQRRSDRTLSFEPSPRSRASTEMCSSIAGQ